MQSDYYHESSVHVILQELFKINVLGGVHTTKVLLPSMIEKKSGRIVFIASQAGQVKS